MIECGPLSCYPLRFASHKEIHDLKIGSSQAAPAFRRQLLPKLKKLHRTRLRPLIARWPFSPVTGASVPSPRTDFSNFDSSSPVQSARHDAGGNRASKRDGTPGGKNQDRAKNSLRSLAISIRSVAQMNRWHSVAQRIGIRALWVAWRFKDCDFDPAVFFVFKKTAALLRKSNLWMIPIFAIRT